MKVIKQRFARGEPVAANARSGPDRFLGFHSRPGLAKTILRFQRLERTKTDRKTALYASQSGEARTGGAARPVEMEQFPFLLLCRAGYGSRNFQERPLEIKACPVENFTDARSTRRPLIRKYANEMGTPCVYL